MCGCAQSPLQNIARVAVTSGSIVGRAEWDCGEGATGVCSDGSTMQKDESVRTMENSRAAERRVCKAY